MGLFEKAIGHVLVHEGGYVNHPRDPGGATNRGIIQRTYDNYRRSLGMALVSVRNISEKEVLAIYKREYWDKIMGDFLPVGLGYIVFDGGVNSGVGQSVKWLQRALRDLGLYAGQIDGLIGQGTLGAVSRVNDVDALIAKVIERREAFLRQLKTFKTFGKGWMRRISGVLATGQAWAVGSVGPAPVFSLEGSAKAFVSDAKPSPNVGAADAVAGGGSSSIGIGALLESAKVELSPLAGSSELINYAVSGLIVAGVVVAVGGFAYRWYAKRKRDARADALDLQAVPA